MGLMKDNIIHFYNKNYIIDDSKCITVSIKNNLIFLEYYDKTDNIRIRVSSYKNTVKILSALGYEIVQTNH